MLDTRLFWVFVLSVLSASACSVQSSTGSGGANGTAASVGGAGGGAGEGGAKDGVIGPSGGTLDSLAFAIVGDTRPPTEGDLAGYPTAIISKIWQEAEAAKAPFAITTGDYQFSKATSPDAGPQLDKYLGARAAFTNVVFPAMGNHECTGATASNCGAGNANGVTQTYTTYIEKLLTPIGQTKPYYEIDVASTTNAWTSKFVFIAANAWDSTQASWLEASLAKPTTYTFVVRHERSEVTDTPGVKPSSAIIAKHPFTILVVGHTHTYSHDTKTREITVGNGGAPLTSAGNYGYVMARMRASDGAIEFSSYDYSSNAVVDHFAVNADGSAAP